MRQRLLGTLCAASLVALPFMASAESWEETFRTIGAEVGGPGENVIVVLGGERTESSKQAELALLATARGSAKLAMDGGSLGDLGGLADAEIVAKCKHLPVSRVVILRVFQGDAGGTAVVTIYDKGAEPIAGFSGIVGQAIDTALEPGRGVSLGASMAISALSTAAKLTRVEAQERFDQSYLWFEDWVAVSLTHGEVGRWFVPYQGKHKQSLSGSEFYELVGRAEYADSYRARAMWRTGLLIGGVGGLVGGIGYTTYGAFSSFSDVCTADSVTCAKQTEEVQSKLISRVAVGGALAGIGLTALIVRTFIDPHPIGSGEARKLADEFNNELKKELGLSSRAPAFEPRIVAVPGG